MQAQEPVKVAPNIYKKIFENDRVRVCEVSLKAGEKIGMHSHPAHLAYALTPAKLRTANGWGEPNNAGAPINSPGSEWYPTMAADGTLYFGSDRAGGLGQTDLYRCKLQDGKYQNIENLGVPVNSKHDEYEPWISPDQSFLLFMAIRPDGHGRSDLYLSHNENGKWSTPVNLGSEINSSGSEYSPKITSDGKYFFFTSTRGSGIQSFPSRLNYPELLKKLRGPGNGLGDIYSVDVSILPVNKR